MLFYAQFILSPKAAYICIILKKRFKIEMHKFIINKAPSKSIKSKCNRSSVLFKYIMQCKLTREVQNQSHQKLIYETLKGQGATNKFPTCEPNQKSFVLWEHSVYIISFVMPLALARYLLFTIILPLRFQKIASFRKTKVI